MVPHKPSSYPYSGDMWQVKSWGQWPLGQAEHNPSCHVGHSPMVYIDSLGAWSSMYTNFQIYNP